MVQVVYKLIGLFIFNEICKFFFICGFEKLLIEENFFFDQWFFVLFFYYVVIEMKYMLCIVVLICVIEKVVKENLITDFILVGDN